MSGLDLLSLEAWGGGPGLLRYYPQGRAPCLALGGFSEFGEGTAGTGTQTSELTCGGSCIEISPAVLLVERLQVGLRCWHKKCCCCGCCCSEEGLLWQFPQERESPSPTHHPPKEGEGKSSKPPSLLPAFPVNVVYHGELKMQKSGLQSSSLSITKLRAKGWG